MVTTNLRVPYDLLDRIKVSAKKNNRSMNGEILQALIVYLKSQEKKDKEIEEKSS